MKKSYPLLLFIFSILTFSETAYAQFKVIGYYPTYAGGYPTGVSSLDLAKITHLNIAFANPNSSGTLSPDYGTTGNITTVVNACHAKGVKVFMSLGGGGASGTNYQTLLSSSTNINNFVTKIVSFATTYGLDGIDIDIEGNILNGSTLTASQYESFVTALKTALHAQSLNLSAALGSWFGSYVTSTAAAQFDWINMMSYDLCGSWTGPCQHSPYSMTTSDFQYWNTTKGVPASKLIVGVPFYGYGWGTYSNSGISYCDIVNTYPGSENSDQVGSGSNVIYYNGISTIKQKTTYAFQNAAGIMIWELTQDCSTSDSRSLLLAINQVISTLPVTWNDFNVQHKNSSVRIYWSTSTEKGNDYYSIERSTDEVTFTEIGIVKSIGNSNSLNEYSYFDRQPVSGNTFYRIKQIDINGNYSYSPIIAINHIFSDNIIFEVNPNPASQNEIKVEFINSCDEQILELTDILGKIYYREVLTKDQAKGIITINPDRSISSGIYFLTASCNGKIYRLKIQVN